MERLSEACNAQTQEQLFLSLAKERIVEQLLAGNCRLKESDLQRFGLGLSCNWCVVTMVLSKTTDFDMITFLHLAETRLNKELKICTVHACYSDYHPAQFLFCFQDPPQTNAWVQKTYRTLDAMIPLGIKLCAGFSAVASGYDRIPVCMKQAKMAVSYGVVRERWSALRIDQIRDIQEDYYYPNRSRELLSISIGNHNRRQAKSILHSILFYEASTFEKKGVQKLFSELCTIILLGVPDCERTAQAAESLSEVYAYTELYPAKLRLETLIDEVCTCEGEASAEEVLIDERILSYIEENRLNADISLSSIATRFQKSSSYISKLVKDKTGLMYIDYVNQFRIAESVRLMSGAYCSPKDVYLRVGYVSYTTFHRNFIKYTNTTPGTYQTARGHAPQVFSG